MANIPTGAEVVKEDICPLQLVSSMFGIGIVCRLGQYFVCCLRKW